MLIDTNLLNFNVQSYFLLGNGVDGQQNPWKSSMSYQLNDQEKIEEEFDQPLSQAFTSFYKHVFKKK